MGATEANNSHVTNGNARAQPDFELLDEGGSIVVLRPVTMAADEWVAHFISMEAPLWAGGVVIERSWFQEILDGIDDNGLTVGPWTSIGTPWGEEKP
jgi:hypothetical protein